MPDFNEIMGKTVEETQRPPLPPIGTYEMFVNKIPESRDIVSPKGSWNAIEFTFTATRALDDVDQDELREYGAPKQIMGLRRSFMFPKGNTPEDKTAFAQTEANLKDFLTKHLGIDPKLSYKEAFTVAVNKKCLGSVAHRQDPNNPENFYPDLKRTAPISTD